VATSIAPQALAELTATELWTMLDVLEERARG
jgi:hypothetical protein